MNGRRLMVLLVAVLALVAAGCGGGGSDEASSDTDTVATSTTTEDMTATEATATEATDTTATDSTETVTATTGTDTSSDDFDASKLGGKCAEFAGIGAKISAALSGQNADPQAAAALIDQLADAVPDEIKADFHVIAEYVKKWADAMKGVDLSSGKQPSADQLAKLQQLAASADTQQLQQASQHLEAWAKANC